MNSSSAAPKLVINARDPPPHALVAATQRIPQMLRRLGERISCGVVDKMMVSVFRRSSFFITAELHMWRSKYNCDRCTNPAAIYKWRIRLHI
ncbi:hypothetical protein EVAR_13418_1 [Eumeta japonica]|uniref:Uncharacterized protein n=1 Tax=Eumeta variegata TaxID=151549 RepID=A0A4C1V6L7_EUMVA|nr:hypothetical protein EVAR_13418_1 [Eumeta japonica]